MAKLSPLKKKKDMCAKYYTNLNPYLLQSFMIKRREQDLPASKKQDEENPISRYGGT